MSIFPGVPVDAAYHVVRMLAGLLAPLPAGLATAAAIAGFTVATRLLLLPLSYRAMRGTAAQARMAPQVQALRTEHAGQPDRLQRELAALYRTEGTSMFAGCLPLAQWPVLSVLYLLFRSPRINGAPNTLLSHGLFGAPLGSHWLGGAGPLSGQGVVFAGLFLLLAGIGWLSARLARRASAPATRTAGAPATRTAGTPATRTAGTPATRTAGAPATRTAGTRTAGGAATGISGGPADLGGATTAVPAALARVLPYLSMAVAAFVPLAAGLYLVTTGAWTLGERAVMLRLRPGAGAH
jgi:YidC/Oxa1 family membrane protein insertase